MLKHKNTMNSHSIFPFPLYTICWKTTFILGWGCAYQVSARSGIRWSYEQSCAKSSLQISIHLKLRQVRGLSLAYTYQFTSMKIAYLVSLHSSSPAGSPNVAPLLPLPAGTWCPLLGVFWEHWVPATPQNFSVCSLLVVVPRGPNQDWSAPCAGHCTKTRKDLYT